MTSLLDQASQWLYEINPTLSKIPPRADVEGEICYLGPDGTLEDAVKCSDIPYSMATCVGSWLLPPQHHIVEGLVVTLLALALLTQCWPSRVKAIIPQQSSQQHQQESYQLQVHHPVWARPVSIVCFGMICGYKYFGYPRRIYYMVMPCNMQWTLSFIQTCALPESWQLAQYALLQMRLTFLMSVVIAIVTPETDDCLLPGEYAFYWINHFLLLALPLAYVANGSVSTLPTATTANQQQSASTKYFNFLWWQFSCCLMAIFYFIPVTLLAVKSGLNLNFMMHPPHDHFALKGQYFRIVAVAMLAVLFGVSRWMVYALETTVLKSHANMESTTTKSKKES